MASRLKSFGYPVLSPNVDDFYDDQKFEVFIDAKAIEDTNEVEIDFEITLECDHITDLLLAKQASIFFDLKSATTFYRRLLPIEALKGSFRISNGEALGKLRIDPMILTTSAIENHWFRRANAEYGDVPRFNLGAGAILGYDNSMSIDLRFKRESLSGLFIVTSDENRENRNSYTIEAAGNAIAIRMGENARKAHEYLRATGSLKALLSTSVYKDACVYAISQIYSDAENEELAWAQIFSTKLDELGISVPDEPDFDSLNIAALKLLSSFGYEKFVKEMDNE